MQIGYARVSTRDQDLEIQLSELKAAGCERIFFEKESGAKTDRPELARALAFLQRDDLLIVTRLDRLARSMRDLLNVVEVIDERGAKFKSLKDPWIDTATPHGRLLLGILGSLAEFERELIKQRTHEGIARARANGIKPGPKPKLPPGDLVNIRAGRAAGLTLKVLAAKYDVDPATIWRCCNE